MQKFGNDNNKNKNGHLELQVHCNNKWDTYNFYEFYYEDLSSICNSMPYVDLFDDDSFDNQVYITDNGDQKKRLLYYIVMYIKTVYEQNRDKSYYWNNYNNPNEHDIQNIYEQLTNNNNNYP